MLTEKGILLMYNSRNVPSKKETPVCLKELIQPHKFLLDGNDPSKVLQRMETGFIKPDKPYEIAGQVNHVCFLEGLVNYKNQWFLYLWEWPIQRSRSQVK